MEAWLYAILHMVFYITTGIALCGYMYLFTWQYCEGVSGDSFFALVMPTFASAIALLFAWALGLTVSDDTVRIAIFGDALTFAGTVASAWVHSVVRYRDEGYDPEYVTFFVVACYSLIIFLGSVLLLLFV